MLTKLLGYEMKAFGRIILPLYAATIGMAMVIGLGIRFLPEETYTNVFGGIVIMAFSALIIATMVMTGILCVQRFYQNLLGNEGYLMFSLPAATHELILSKVLGSLIWTLLGGVAAVCTVIAMGLAIVPFGETIRALRELNLYIDMQMLGKNIGSSALWALVAILLFAASLMQIYAAIAIGHQWSSHRILGSILAYFGIDIIKSLLAAALGKIGLHTGFLGIFLMEAEKNASHQALAQGAAAGTAAAYILVYSLITWYLLDRRLNLE